MSGESFQFIHASDFHLEQPPRGLADAPDHLREVLADCAMHAATRVFEAAILEDVDFVLLCGDVIDVGDAGPRTIAFLLEQFELLREQRIQVYWAGGAEEAFERWPDEFHLPANVQRFPSTQVQQFTHSRGELPIANIVGMSAAAGNHIGPGDFRSDSNTRYTIAATYGEANPDALAAQSQISYWALGGRHQATTLMESPKVIHYSGTPQSRCFQEPGRHGCTLVQVDRGRKTRLRSIHTDVIEFREESVEMGESAQRSELQRQLRSRMQAIASETTEGAALVRWNVQCSGNLAANLRTGGLDKELVDWLRTEFGRAKPAVWTTELSLGGGTELSEDLYDEDTILGDFLRAIREFEKDPSRKLDFSPFLKSKQAKAAVDTALQLSGHLPRSVLLQEVAEHGVDLLRGAELRSEDAA